MTRASRPGPVWPFLLILLAPFVLSTTAPRDWEQCARNESLLQTLFRQPPQVRKLAQPSRPLAGPQFAAQAEPTIAVEPVIKVSREFELPPVPAAPVAESKHAFASDADVLKIVRSLTIVGP